MRERERERERERDGYIPAVQKYLPSGEMAEMYTSVVDGVRHSTDVNISYTTCSLRLRHAEAGSGSMTLRTRLIDTSTNILPHTSRRLSELDQASERTMKSARSCMIGCQFGASVSVLGANTTTRVPIAAARYPVVEFQAKHDGESCCCCCCCCCCC